jgi:hypothetical protein
MQVSVAQTATALPELEAAHIATMLLLTRHIAIPKNQLQLN